jgi:aspartyl/asparaginyl beta-hydroxylase (cupin superfamily)
MKEGEIWEINNKYLHGVKNQSEFDRIHLIIDYDVKNSNISYY